ncbi:MAG: glycine--tRNA ligase subunit beta, partial [Desulfobacula sp.]|nr:glycine--tRNA ligase subunit beta [Desulfobacula sp.]
MKSLLIEIGVEEIPAGYIIPALNAFKKNILAALDKSRIDHGPARIMGTPRRLVLFVKSVGDMQKAQSSTITGPPEKIAFDAEGNPKIPAEKFAAKAGISLEDIEVADMPKGRYLTATIQEKCETSILILESMLESQILAIPFPKRMRWGDLSISFARPIICLVGLLGDTVLNFEVGNIKSSNLIFGHPFMSPGKYRLPSADQYVEVVE